MTLCPARVSYSDKRLLYLESVCVREIPLVRERRKMAKRSKANLPTNVSNEVERERLFE